MFLVLPLLNQNTEAEKRVNRKQCKSQKQRAYQVVGDRQKRSLETEEQVARDEQTRTLAIEGLG